MNVYDILSFRSMLAPWLIRALFVLGTILCIGGGIVLYWTSVGSGTAFAAIALIFVGPIALRLMCEFAIVVFEIYETLDEIERGILR